MYVQSSCLIAKDRINIVQLVLVVADKSRDQNQSQTGFITFSATRGLTTKWALSYVAANSSIEHPLYKASRNSCIC